MEMKRKMYVRPSLCCYATGPQLMVSISGDPDYGKGPDTDFGDDSSSGEEPALLNGGDAYRIYGDGDKEHWGY